ncbi:ribonuclease [Pseudomonas soli]|uniref:Ribonuclease n=1 Tax=Pseudomonas soli TaxID=1306993 RepID=A0AAJ5SRT7_9PSED|nr:ribonuclease [Pseudomonas soli]PYC37477.1 ribonuclease [Pseudomonas soli]UXZ44003.1 ribonuclease [Pseudomonas soli]
MQWTPQSATCLKALLFGCLAAAASPTFAEQICALPDNVEPAPARPVDYVNKDLPTDYLALVLSWSPEHCEAQRNKPKAQREKHAFQCFSGNRFEWVVHGLWPQNGYARSNQDHPRNCQTVGSLPAPLVRQHLCMMPGPDLMQNEWQAHGTCGWSSPERYFTDIQRVYDSLQRPSLQEMLGSEAGPNQLVDAKVSDIKQAFLAHNPALPAQSLRVSVGSGNRLKELWVCLDKQLGPTPCPAGGTPDNQQIKVRAPFK